MSEESNQLPLHPDLDSAPISETSAWIAILVQRHYASLYRLVYSSLGDDRLSRQAVIKILAGALVSYRRYNQRLDTIWLYDLALRRTSEIARQSTTLRKPQTAVSDLDKAIWSLVDSFEYRERLLCVLLFVLNWPAASAARLLNVSESAVRTQQHLFQQLFLKKLKGIPQAAQTTSPQGIGTPTGGLFSLVSTSLQARWPAPEIAADDWTNILEQIQQTARQEQARLGKQPQRRWIFLAAATLLSLGVCLALGMIYWLNISTPSFIPLLSDAPLSSPMPAVRQARPLGRFSRSSDILERIQESAQLWGTLWIDMQVARFGPPNYRGAPRLYRLQAWVSQPAQSIQLFGQLSEEPSSVYIFRGWRSDYINPRLNLSYSKEAAATPEALIENAELRQMIFPASSTWATQPGYFKVIRAAKLLNRDALVVDWRDQYGQRQVRLWLDVQTGILLRQQTFSGEHFDLLLSENIVTDLALDQISPPAQLGTAMQDIQGVFPTQSELDPPKIILPTPTAALQIENRPSFGFEPAPSGFDPSHSQLAFEFPNNLAVSNAITGTADIPISLFADGYLLGASRFGLPWMLRCARSPDGLRLAFTTTSDGTSFPDDALRWLDLREPGKVFQPLPGIHAMDFAFSPNSLTLAVFAKGATAEQDGIYLVNLGMGEYAQILSLTNARSLVWSLDGEFLAVIGAPEAGKEEVLILHVRSKQIAFRAAPLAAGEPIPEEWPISNWGVAFPVELGDIQNCASPPSD